MKKILTVVIPAYNVEQTLQKTVESLLFESKELLNVLDILIVNDGSTDGTLELATKMEEAHPDIVRVWNKQNGGHGSTINVGIEHGLGKYMKVVDGDDWLVSDALGEYLRILNEIDVDLVATDYYHYYMNDGTMKAVKSSKLPYGKIMSFSEIWKEYSFYMHSFAIKTELLRNQPYRIDEHCFYVDVEYDTLAALSVETILYVDMKLYVYRLQRAGQSVSIQGWIRHYLDHEKVSFTLVKWHSILKDHQEKEKTLYLEKRIIRSAGWHYDIGFDFPPSDRKTFVLHLKNYDIQLKQAGRRIYALTGRKFTIKILRYVHFSIWAYTALAIIRKVKNTLRKPFRIFKWQKGDHA